MVQNMLFLDPNRSDFSLVDFETWRERMRKALEGMRIDYCIRPELKPVKCFDGPVRPHDAGTWPFDNNLAIRTILIHLSPSIRPEFEACGFACDIWVNLLLRYGSGDAFYARKLLLIYESRVGHEGGLIADSCRNPGETDESLNWRRILKVKQHFPEPWFWSREGLAKLSEWILATVHAEDSKELANSRIKRDRQVKRMPRVFMGPHKEWVNRAHPRSSRAAWFPVRRNSKPVVRRRYL